MKNTTIQSSSPGRKEIESKIEKIGVVGDRYDAVQQSRVEY
jgi:hypothetical protein